MSKPGLYKKIFNHDIAIILIFLFLFSLGVFSLYKIRVTFMPRLSEPILTIVTDYYEMEPGIIEEVITKPIESLLKEIEGIRDFYSFTSRGRSKIILYLDKGENVDRKAVLIKDKIYHISDKFPAEVHEPAIYKYNTDESPLMIISLTSKKYGMDELYNLMEQKVKPRLLSIEGIANIEIAGSSQDEYFIELRYENLERLKGDFEALFEEIVKNNAQVPLGNIENSNSMSPVTFPNKYKDLFDLPGYPVNLDGNLISGHDLFSIKKQKRENERAILINNRPALTLYIFKKDFSNILNIERDLRFEFNRWTDFFSYSYIYNQAGDFLNLLKQLALGIITALISVFLIVLVFYKRISLSLLIVLTITLSLGGTLTFLNLFSRSLNIMTLSGIIVGIAVCVNNAIIMIETTMMHKKNIVDERSFFTSMARVNKTLLASSLTTIVVFLPLFSTSSGAFQPYIDFALSFSLMLIMSYLICLFFIPSLVGRFHSGEINKESRLYSKKVKNKKLNIIKSLPLFIIKKIMEHPVISICSFIIISGVSAYLFIKLEYEEVTPLKVNEFEFYYEFEPEFNRAYNREEMIKIGEEILGIGLPFTLVSKIEDTRATFFLKFPYGYGNYREDVTKVKEYLSKYHREDGFFYFQKGRESGTKSITLNFFGDNIETLDGFVDGVSFHLNGFYGIKQILKGYKKGKPEISFIINADKMYYYNLNISEVIRLLRYIFYYPVIMKHYEGESVVDIRGKIGIDNLKKDDIPNLRLLNERGEFLRLRDFSRVTLSDSPGVVTRKNGKRYISLDIRYEDVREGAMLNRIVSLLKNTRFEKDFYYEIDEELIERKKGIYVFAFTMVLALFMVYAVLGIILKSFKDPLIIILTTPSIFIGCLIFLWLGGHGRSIPANIALILLIGLSVNNIVYLMEEILSLKRIGKIKSILLGYRRKLNLIAITLLTTLFSLVPVFIFATSTHFFRILIGVLFSGMLFNIIFSSGIFPGFYILLNKK